jgi:hypothetical protein
MVEGDEWVKWVMEVVLPRTDFRSCLAYLSEIPASKSIWDQQQWYPGVPYIVRRADGFLSGLGLHLVGLL